MGRTTSLGLATALLFLVLIQPNHPAAMTWGALRLFPLELPVLILVLVALPARGMATSAIRAAVVVALMVIAVLKAADYASFVSYNRGFNPVTDLHLLPAAWNLASGSIGAVLAALALVAALMVVLMLTAALWWATGRWASVALPGPMRAGAAVLALPALALAVAEIGQARRAWSLPASPPGAAFTARVGIERAELVRRTMGEMAEFRTAALTDPLRDARPLFDRLGGADLVIVFVESYGNSSLINPLYEPVHGARLRDIATTLDAHGLAMRTGLVTAPTIGGQSWLAHGTLASGLWIDSQPRYRAMLASPRQSLFHHAQDAGKRSVAIMPAHVFDWPEGAFLGFDAIYNAPDLGYRGERFNWVTMPDQFTLAAFDRLERDRADRPPLLAQVVLVSSHAPWIPVPPVIPWEDIGDGTIFNQWATSGDPPEVVWRDPDRIRAEFTRAVDYSLDAVGAYLELHADARALTIVLGDHEPAPFVAGVDSLEVPVHVIGPPDLVALVEGWGWAEGMIPDQAGPVWRMDELRARLISALSSGAP
ncbi:MAG: sulfatase [Rhodobacteraceae bacterium]|nr:sulfatase [Paracoccaceae bacterium]